MNKMTACAAALGLVLVAHHPNLAEASNSVRPTHDVACTLKARNNAADPTGATVRAKLTVRNRSRKNEAAVSLAIYANAPIGTPLWTGTIGLKAHRSKTRKVEIEVPGGTTSLVAVATCDDDDNPGNNISGVEVEGHEDGDDDGGTPTVPPTTPVPPAVDPAVLAGAATYATNCASCHGVDAKGTRLGERILGKSAHDVLEAMREGEDDMPKFPNMTSTDASNIAAFLKNPAAATQPTTPVTPPPTGTAPTYTAQIKTLLQSNCTVCHTGASAPANIRLETYAFASANATATLSAMSGNRMPPGSPMSQASIQLFTDWINGGKQQ